MLKACGIDNLVNKVKPTNKPTEKDRKSEIITNNISNYIMSFTFIIVYI